LVCKGVWTWRNYLHLLANWMHWKCSIWLGVWASKIYLHLWANWMHLIGFFYQCSNSKELPSSIGQLNALRWLFMSKCSNFRELLSSIGQLNALERRVLSRCSNLKELPLFVVQLNALQSLHLEGARIWRNYLHLLANWMDSRSFIG
jgi:hypothetical protein